MKENRNSFLSLVWVQFRKSKPALYSVYFLFVIVLLSIVSDFVANRQPLYARYRGRNFYPAFETLFHKTLRDSTLNPNTNKFEILQFDITDWRQLSLNKVIWAPIPYSASQNDKYNADFVQPGAIQHYKNRDGNMVTAPYIFRHHLGTDRIGEDVASGLIHGAGIALRVGLISMAIAAVLGILLGTTAGFFGDYRIRVMRGSFLLAIPGLFLGIFYGFIVRNDILKQAFDLNFIYGIIQSILNIIIMIFITLISGYAGGFLSRIKYLSKKIFIPADIFISKMIEIFDSIPALVFIITVSALFIDKSLSVVIVIIGVLSSPQIARLTRAEFIRIRNLDYVQSAQALGITDLRIIFRHILPNALAPVFVALAFGAASAIIAESSLSFLGIGVPADTVTWGSMLSYSRDDFSAWWMVVFPGLAIFIMVTVFNLIGEGLRNALNPRAKF